MNSSTSTDDISDADLQQALEALIASHKTLLLGTRNAKGDAELSYAPYLRDEQGFYIFISDLAKHTQNLRAHPQASVMFIAPEDSVRNLFARPRLTLNCSVVEIPPFDPRHAQYLQAMQEKFGNIVALLRSLPDFHLLQLIPEHGAYVAGFGKAHSVDEALRLQTRSSSDS